jgi:DNA-3-methyladenine glycosylase
LSRLRDLLSQPVDVAAPALLGWRLRSRVDGVMTEVMITEVEAYDGDDDPASHAFGGRTARNASMFEPAGTLYVYRSYGIHWCMNVVTGAAGLPGAVLLRGGKPTIGSEIMIERRKRQDHLTDGPGKLAQALGVTGDHDGTPVTGKGPVRLLPGTAPDDITATTRVGISRAAERPWRFVIRR